MKATVAAALAAAFSLIVLTPSPAAVAVRCARPSSYDLSVRLPREYPRFWAALRRDFGAHALEAAIVSYGEGSWHAWARNGQYRGTFQLGSSERARYGDSQTLVGQSHAAARYFHAEQSRHVYGWTPWLGGCAP